MIIFLGLKVELFTKRWSKNFAVLAFVVVVLSGLQRGESAAEENFVTEKDKASPAKEAGQDLGTANTAEPLEIGNWFGVEVISHDIDDLGEIEDVVVNLETGMVSHLIIDNAGLYTGSSIVEIRNPRLDSARVQIAASRETVAKFDEGNLESTERLSDDLVGTSIVDANGQQVGKIARLLLKPNSLDAYVVVNELEEKFEMSETSDEIAVSVRGLEVTSEGEFRLDLEHGVLADSTPVDIRSAKG